MQSSVVTDRSDTNICQKTALGTSTGSPGADFYYLKGVPNQFSTVVKRHEWWIYRRKMSLCEFSLFLMNKSQKMGCNLSGFRVKLH